MFKLNEFKEKQNKTKQKLCLQFIISTGCVKFNGNKSFY